MPLLQVVVYHYVRDLPRSRFPRIKGMQLDRFREQTDCLRRRYEMATLESALDFLKGSYQPKRDLCLLTFDDGLKEHFGEVTPLLAERGIQGVFFVVTGCLEERRVAPVHMNHFLMASLDFGEYRAAFERQLSEIAPTMAEGPKPDPATVRRTYPLDTPDVAEFKYRLNFILDGNIRDRLMQILFERYLGDEENFSRELYVSWEDCRQMQDEGMVIGGHTHEHRPLATMDRDEQGRDLSLCRALIERNLRPQAGWPFCYPYGKKESFNSDTVRELRRLGFACSFVTETGDNAAGADLFGIRRFDCNSAPMES
jgi:peptidoglycan/xylan/chitin deacetylase (PgdA/CDA1 family)